MSFSWQDRQVCVTGGSGFLGRNVVAQLRELGARVKVLALPPKSDSPRNEAPGVELIHGDLLDPEVARRAVADCSVVFHLAGTIAVWGPALKKMHSIHVEGTRRILAACAPDTRVVHTSSVVAVGATPSGEILDEESPFSLGSLGIDYVHAKRNAEQIALAAAEKGQNIVVVNPAYLVGPDDFEPSVMGRFCARFWRGRVPLAPPGGLNFVDVRDAARGHLLAAEHGCSGRRYILAGENHSLVEFMRMLTEPAQVRPRAFPVIPGAMLNGVATIAEWRANRANREPYPSRQHALMNQFFWYYRSDRAMRELGYQSRPLRETIRTTYEWFAAQKPFQWRGFNRWWMRPAA